MKNKYSYKCVYFSIPIMLAVIIGCPEGFLTTQYKIKPKEDILPQDKKNQKPREIIKHAFEGAINNVQKNYNIKESKSNNKQKEKNIVKKYHSEDIDYQIILTEKNNHFILEFREFGHAGEGMSNIRRKTEQKIIAQLKKEANIKISKITERE